jgi:methionyl-tRNA formyltransferase
MAHVVECSNRSDLSIGTLDENLHVICGSDALEIDKIKPASGSVMDFGSFVNGHRLRPGDKFTGLAN